MHPHASLNKSFRLVWNATTAVWQAVGEIGSAHSKGHTARTLRRTRQAALATAALLLAGHATASVLPTDGTIVSGNGNISQSGNVMTIQQNSARMAADFGTFNIGAANTVNVVQPSSSSSALFRVLGNEVSAIQGRLTANGHIFLQNPNGVLFAPGAQVDVGSLVASTLTLGVDDFMAGNYRFAGDSSASITNQGRITAHGDNGNGGTIALVAARIVNEGTLTADRGQVLLGAGAKVLLDLGGPVKLEVQQGTLDALITNGGAIRADGGTVLLTAKALGDLSHSVINHTGLVQAQTLGSNEKGEITLLAPGEQITVAGTLDASALQGGSGGRIVATGTRVLVEDGAHLTASGKNGGGEVLVGGSWQNSNPAIYQATQTLVKAGAVLEADATDVGDGGTVVAWSDIHKSDSTTQAYGKFSAKGGARGGNGGRIETSGYWLDVAGITANASAAMGRSGQWLLDPYNITISSSATTAGPGFPNWTSAADSSVVQNTDIEAQLNTGTSVTIATGSGGAGLGNIVVAANIAKTGGTDATLTLKAHNAIEINAGTSITSSVGALNVVLNSDSDATNGGYIWLGKGNTPSAKTATTITTNGGYLTLSGGTDVTTGYAQGASTIISNGIVLDMANISTGGGNIVVRGKSGLTGINFANSDATSSSNSDGIRLHGSNLIDSGTGTIQFTGVAQGTGSSSSNGIETSQTGYTRITSAATNTTAISFHGDATQGTAANGWGTFLWGTNTSGIVLAATGTGGGITLVGNGRNTSTGGGVHLEPNAFVLAASGPIAITGTKGAASTYEDIVINSTVGYVATLPAGFGVPSPVTASSSNITLTADSLSANRVFGGGTFSGSAVQSTGILTIAPRTAGKAMAVQTANPGGTAFWIDPTSMFGASGLFKTGFSKLVFGSSTTGNVTLNNYSFNNDTEINTSGNAVLGAVTIANGKALTVNMTGSGSITDTGTVAVANLKLNGSTSAVTLDSAANAIGTVAGSVASLTIANSTALTVGSVGGTNGVTATGNIDIATLSGDLTVSQNVSTSATSASAIVLNAGKSAAPTTTTGGNIVLTGSRSFTTGSGGRAVLYSGDDAGSTGLSTLVFAAGGTVTGNTDESTNPAATSGVNAVFRGTPPVAPVVTPPSTPATTPTNTSTASVTPAVQNAQQLPVEPPKPVNVALPSVPTGAGGSSGSNNFELSTNGGLRFLDLPANTVPGTGVDTAATGGTAGTAGNAPQGGGSLALANTGGTQGGIDPFGFMRVFVTGGGITMPSLTAVDSNQENDANQNP